MESRIKMNDRDRYRYQFYRTLKSKDVEKWPTVPVSELLNRFENTKELIYITNSIGQYELWYRTEWVSKIFRKTNVIAAAVDPRSCCKIFKVFYE